MKQLDPKAVWLFFIKYLLGVVFVFLIFVIFRLASTGGNKEIGIIGYLSKLSIIDIVVIVALVAWCYVWAKLNYNAYKYELTNSDFREEFGVINKKHITIPYNRIQNININRSILSRFFGLSDLDIETAGSGAVVVLNRYNFDAQRAEAEGRLPCLSKEVAEQLRDELMNRSNQSKSSQN